MAGMSQIKDAMLRWKEHCKKVQAATGIDIAAGETPVEKEKRIAHLLSHYNEFCEYYFPHYLNQTNPETGELRVVHNAKFHNDAARDIKANPNFKGVFKWPRAHAKSTHLDVFIPMWLKAQKQIRSW